MTSRDPWAMVDDGMSRGGGYVARDIIDYRSALDRRDAALLAANEEIARLRGERSCEGCIYHTEDDPARTLACPRCKRNPTHRDGYTEAPDANP